MPSVKILNGPNRDQAFQLRGGELVGRDPGNAIQVFAPGVSRRHFQFSVENGQVFVTDLGSSNGTYVNNNRITKHLLIENDTITVGGINLRYSKGDGSNIVADPIGNTPAPPGSLQVGPGTFPVGPAGPPSRKLSFSQEEVPVGAFGSMPSTTPMGADPGAHASASASQVVLKDDPQESEGGGAEDYSLDASIVF